MTSNLSIPAAADELFPPRESHRPRGMQGGLACADGLPGNWPVRFHAADDEAAPAGVCFSGGILCGTGAIALVAACVLGAGGGRRVFGAAWLALAQGPGIFGFFTDAHCVSTDSQRSC